MLFLHFLSHFFSFCHILKLYFHYSTFILYSLNIWIRKNQYVKWKLKATKIHKNCIKKKNISLQFLSSKQFVKARPAAKSFFGSWEFSSAGGWDGTLKSIFSSIWIIFLQSLILKLWHNTDHLNKKIILNSDSGLTNAE